MPSPELLEDVLTALPQLSLLTLQLPTVSLYESWFVGGSTLESRAVRIRQLYEPLFTNQHLARRYSCYRCEAEKLKSQNIRA